MTHLSDLELITRYISENDERCFTQLYNRHRQRVYLHCLSYTGSSDDSEDFVQEIFMRLMRKLISYKGDAKFTSWLHVVTVNYCLDRLRKRQKEQIFWRNYMVEATLNSDWTTTPEESYFQASEKVLRQLSINQRTLLLTKYEDRKTINEIALSQRLTSSAVKMRIKRARDYARSLYDQALAEQDYV